VGFDLQPAKDHRGIIQILECYIKKPAILEKSYLLDRIPELNLLSGNLSQLSKLKVTALLDEIVLAVIEDVHPDKSREFGERLLNILQKDFSSKINLDRISKELSISKTQLERLAIKEFGYGVIEFYNQLRVSKACMYLSDYNISIKEISDRLGFCDQAHFNRFFKSKTKYTPVQFRKQNHSL
jgi:AraC-like DNA-binding protein